MPLPSDWTVPDLFRSRLGDSAGRQRAMEAAGHLLLVLHQVPDPGIRDRAGVYFWRSPEGEWKATRRGIGVHALRGHLEDFSAAVAGLEDQLERAASAADYYAVLQRSVPLHRTASHFLETLQQARELIKHDRDLIILRDLANDIARAAELLHADAVHGLNFSMAERSEELANINQQLAQTSNRINLLATIFLPLTAIAAIFSMKPNSGLENLPGAFYIILLLSLGTGFWIRHSLANAASPPRDKASPREDRKSSR